MGREIKRVPLNFGWPIGEVWAGFLNPHYAEQQTCPLCVGKFHTPEAQYIYDQWYGNAAFDPSMTGSTPFAADDPIVVSLATRNVSRAPEYYGTDRYAVHRECKRLIGHWNKQWCHHLDAADVAALAAADRLWDFTRRARTPEQEAVVAAKLASGGNSWLPESNGYTPAPEEVNRWSLQGFGHDSINCSICVRAKCERLGIQVYCAACNGEGTVPDPDLEARIEAWQPVEPPTGDGWQLWETVSEGSPVSPVFADADGLIAWLISDQDYSPQAARAFVQQGWVPSMVGVEGVGVWDGITAAGIFAAKANEQNT